MAESAWRWLPLLGLFLAGTGSGADLPDQTQCRQLWEQQLNVKTEIQGWCLLIDENRGNCLTCHHLNIPYDASVLAASGNIGPVLESMQEKFQDRRALRDQIFDASTNNPDTVMPLYGKHQILNSREIDQIVKFLMTF